VKIDGKPQAHAIRERAEALVASGLADQIVAEKQADRDDAWFEMVRMCEAVLPSDLVAPSLQRASAARAADRGTLLDFSTTDQTRRYGLERLFSL